MELRRLGVICLLSASVFAMTGGRADAAALTYTFDVDAQGWTGTGTGQPPVVWNGSGNPGGAVSVAVSGGISGSGPITPTIGIFRAISLNLNNYGGTLSLDNALLTSSNLTGVGALAIQLQGLAPDGTQFIFGYQVPLNLLGGGWQSTSVKLDTSAAWSLTLNKFPFPEDRIATQADWNTYLPLVSGMLVQNSLTFSRTTGGGGSFGYDNIKITEAAPTAMPEPTSMILLATGLAGLGLRRRSA